MSRFMRYFAKRQRTDGETGDPPRGPQRWRLTGLIRLKVLPKAHREDADALQAAVLTLVYQALDGAG
jgi:hypothetical protein